MKSLEQLTQDYWEVSRVWCGHKSNKVITTSTGISKTNHIIASVGPQRKLYKLATNLGLDIIDNSATAKAQ